MEKYTQMEDQSSKSSNPGVALDGYVHRTVSKTSLAKNESSKVDP